MYNPFNIISSFRLSFLPPLMIYLAAGVSGLTNIVGLFFVKEYLDLSAAFLAGLGFWAGLPWVLKMPLGHIVDLIWKFNTDTKIEAACNVPGHYESGMISKIEKINL